MTGGDQRPARRRLTATQRRDLVLNAATRAFAEHGYQGASIQEIAERAGVVASVVYDHFSSKRELYLALLERHGRALVERSVRAQPGGSPAELFDVNVEAFYRFVEADPFVWRMLLRDPPADTEIASAHADIERRASEAMAALIASVRPGAELVPGVPRAQANVMLAEGIKAVNNGLAAWWFEHREVSREQVVSLARALLWTGLERLTQLGGVTGPGGNPGGRDHCR